jgi:hypothetical protein
VGRNEETERTRKILPKGKNHSARENQLQRYIESFNGKFRDECLNRELFRNIREARQVVENWRREYNEIRPHSSLGYLTPSEFAALAGISSRPTVSLRFPPNDQGKSKTNGNDKCEENGNVKSKGNEPILTL